MDVDRLQGALLSEVAAASDLVALEAVRVVGGPNRPPQPPRSGGVTPPQGYCRGVPPSDFRRFRAALGGQR